MKSSVNENYISNFRVYILIIWAVSFPFWIKLSTILLLISFVLYFIDSFILKKNFYTLKQNLPSLCFILLIIVTLFYVDTPLLTLSDLKKKLPLFLMPFVFSNIDAKNFSKIRMFFLTSILIYIFYTLLYAFFKYYGSDYPNFFLFFENFMDKSWHSSYLTLFLLIGIVFILVDIKSDNLRCLNYLEGVILIIISAYIFMLTSRAAQLCLFILLFLYSIRILIKKKRLFILILFSIFGLIIIGLLFDGAREKFKREILKTQYEARNKIWPASISLIKKNYIWGVGDVREPLKQELAKDGFVDMATGKLNSHNQFLEILLSYGLLGILLFLILFLFPLYYMKNKKEYALFSLICVIMFSFESTLNRQAGVIFFAYFSNLIIYNDNTNIDLKCCLKRKKDIMIILLVIVSFMLSLFSIFLWSELVPRNKQLMNIEFSIVEKVRNDDIQRLYYVSDRFNEGYQNYNMVIKKIEGSSDFQEIKFKFSSVNIIRRLRLNLSVYGVEGNVEIKKITISCNDGNILNLDLNKFVANCGQISFFNGIMSFTSNKSFEKFEPYIFYDDLADILYFDFLYYLKLVILFILILSVYLFIFFAFKGLWIRFFNNFNVEI